LDIKALMSCKFSNLQGGLFSTVTKADVGENAGKLMEQGYEIMAWADPFFPDPSIPPSVERTLVENIHDGFPSHYTMPIGNPVLRRAIAAKLKSFNRIDADPTRNILVTPGADAGLFYAMIPFICDEDEVLIPDPSFADFYINVKLCGGIPVNAPIKENTGYQIDVDEFEKRLTPKTKMVLLAHPNNPTATVFRRENIEKLCQFIVRNNLVLVCDQAFEDHIYDGIEFVSPATLPGMWERTVSVFSISKGMGLSGFRVGYLVADDHIMDVLYGGSVNVLGATNTLAQLAAITAFEDEGILREYHSRLERRRRLAYDVFSTIPGVIATYPESGILSWMNVSNLGTGAEIADYLLKEARVIVNDGAAYGELGGKGHIRIVHGVFMDEKKALNAFHRIGDALTRLANEKGYRQNVDSKGRKKL
jgi:aspartate/methionine/tyrosine aminotransferase